MGSCFGKKLYTDLVSQFTHGGTQSAHNLLTRELTDCIVAGFQGKFEGDIM